MTIQIFELTVKMTVEDKKIQSIINAKSNNNKFHTQEELISECVEQTLKRLQQLEAR